MSQKPPHLHLQSNSELPKPRKPAGSGEYQHCPNGYQNRHSEADERYVGPRNDALEHPRSIAA